MSADGFRVGDFRIEWRNEDQIVITNTRVGETAVLDGGDLEGVFSAMVEVARSARRMLAQ